MLQPGRVPRPLVLLIGSGHTVEGVDSARQGTGQLTAALRPALLVLRSVKRSPRPRRLDHPLGLCQPGSEDLNGVLEAVRLLANENVDALQPTHLLAQLVPFGGEGGQVEFADVDVAATRTPGLTSSTQSLLRPIDRGDLGEQPLHDVTKRDDLYGLHHASHVVEYVLGSFGWWSIIEHVFRPVDQIDVRRLAELSLIHI